MILGSEDSVVQVFKLLIGGVCCFGIFVVLGILGEHEGVVKCQATHPRYGTRCVLRARGHYPEMHRDRQGRGWR